MGPTSLSDLQLTATDKEVGQLTATNNEVDRLSHVDYLLSGL